MTTTTQTAQPNRVPSRQLAAFAACLVAFLSNASSQDVTGVTYVTRRESVTHVAFVPARERCENWALGAVLQSILEMQNVALPQSKWVVKLGGTEVCNSFLKAPASLASAIEGDYRLGGAETVHLQARAEDTFVDPGKLIKSIEENRPFIWIWKKHVFMAVAVQYVEARDAGGTRQYDIQEVSLMDPFGGAEQQPAVFRKGPSSLNEVGGIIEVIATK